MKGPSRSSLSRFLVLLRPHRGRLFWAVLTLLLASGAGLIYPQLIRQALDEGLSQGQLDRLDQLVLLALALFAAQAALIWIRHYLMSWLGERVVADLRQAVFAQLVRLDHGWFHARGSGEVVGRLAADVTTVQGVVSSEMSIALRNLVTVLGGVGLLLWENAGLTQWMLLIVPPLSVGIVLFGRVIRRRSRAVQDQLARSSARLQEVIAGIEVVQAFTQEDREGERYGQEVDGIFSESISLARWRASLMSSVSLALYCSVAGILWLGGRAVIAGEISGGELTSFLLYTLMVAASLGSLAGVWGSLQRAGGATERLFELMDTLPAVRDEEEPVRPSSGGSLAFREVHFAYPGRPDHPVLQGLSLTLREGESVALVGPSGSGKSTVARLLLRLYDPLEGEVTLDGETLRGIELQTWRQQLAIVSQDPILFSDSLQDNIAYARPGADLERVQEAAQRAHAHDFILAFPQGYQTLVGERGVQLSGGQRQRIAIARAMLADPRFLVLDEATSSLDAESEHWVQQALQSLMKGRTTLVIAHRLSTVREVDRILVMDQGRVVEEGNHDTLMKAGGIYRQLVERQLLVQPGAA